MYFVLMGEWTSPKYLLMLGRRLSNPQRGKHCQMTSSCALNILKNIQKSSESVQLVMCIKVDSQRGESLLCKFKVYLKLILMLE